MKIHQQLPYNQAIDFPKCGPRNNKCNAEKLFLFRLVQAFWVFLKFFYPFCYVAHDILIKFPRTIFTFTDFIEQYRYNHLLNHYNWFQHTFRTFSTFAGRFWLKAGNQKFLRTGKLEHLAQYKLFCWRVREIIELSGVTFSWKFINAL